MNIEEQNINNQSDVEESNEAEAKKKSRILIIIEIVLFLLVLILALVFFSSRSGTNLNIFNRTNENIIENNLPDSGGLQVNENNTVNQNNTINPNNSNDFEANTPSVFTPDKSNAQVAESLRLSLPVPEQSPVATENDIPEGAVKIEGLESGFSPNEFKVRPGEEVTLALTVKIKAPVILTFYAETMPALSIGCGPYETRWITFKAPSTPGEYIFRNDVFGKSEQTGKMIVE